MAAEKGKDPFTPEARAKSLRVRKRNARLRKKGLLPPVKSAKRIEVSPEALRKLAKGPGKGNGHTKASIKKMLASRKKNRAAKAKAANGGALTVIEGTTLLTAPANAQQRRPTTVSIVARLILEVAEAYQSRGES